MIRLNWLRCAAILSMLVAGCSSPHHGRMGAGDAYWDKAKSDMASLVKKHVADPEKAKEANKVTEEIIAELRKSRDQNRQYHRQLYELNAKYDAAPEEFTKILDEANHSRMQSASRVLGLRFKLKSLLTAQEWNALSQDMMAYGSRYYGKGGDQSRAGGY
jgi:hypothetical protein